VGLGRAELAWCRQAPLLRISDCCDGMLLCCCSYSNVGPMALRCQ
jgi:hypothetical protein